MYQLTANQRYGKQGEEWVADVLAAMGYSVALTPFFDKKDLVINDLLPVEVKRSRAYWRYPRPGYPVKTYGFNVSTIHGKGDIAVVLLVEAEQTYPYIIPSFKIGNRTSIVITSHSTKYGGMWSKYLYRWPNINRCLFLRHHYKQEINNDYRPS